MPGTLARGITLETWIYFNEYKAYSVENYGIVALYQNWDTCLEINDGKWNNPANP
ncbi:MAG: hypothetical protein U9O87_05860 [Verrucomicrobiota bacterium]|nr:hypothetical protein [Verrucomicrobiota bacterium]